MNPTFFAKLFIVNVGVLCEALGLRYGANGGEEEEQVEESSRHHLSPRPPHHTACCLDAWHLQSHLFHSHPHDLTCYSITLKQQRLVNINEYFRMCDKSVIFNVEKQIRDEKNIILADFDEISGCSYFENIILAYFDEIGHILKIFCSPEPEKKIFGRTGDGVREFLLVLPLCINGEYDDDGDGDDNDDDDEEGGGGNVVS